MRPWVRILTPFLTICLTLTVPAPAMATPAIQEARLANGLRILLIEAHNVPMVAMRLSLPAGSRFDPAGHDGAASLLAATLTDHTAKHGHAAWADRLDAQAIRLSSGSSRDALSISLLTLKETLPGALDDLAEAALAPGWDGKRFAQMRDDAVAAARKSLEQPEVRAGAAAVAMVYAQHPYGHRPAGSVAGLAHVTMADMQAIYDAQCRPGGAVLAVSGDVTMAELKPMLAARFGRWHGKPNQPLYGIAAATAAVPGQAHIAMPTRQMTVMLIRQGIGRRSADLFPLLVMNHILGGGGFASRLMNEVREKRGLVYGIYSYFEPLAVPGPFVINLQTRADQAGEAVAVTRRVMQRMQQGHISAAELAAAKDNLAGSFAQRIDENHKRVALMSMIGLYGLPLDYLQVWTSKIDSVSLADVKRVAAAYLDPAAWSLVEVGPEPRGKNAP